MNTQDSRIESQPARRRPWSGRVLVPSLGLLAVLSLSACDRFTRKDAPATSPTVSPATVPTLEAGGTGGAGAAPAPSTSTGASASAAPAGSPPSAAAPSDAGADIQPPVSAAPVAPEAVGRSFAEASEQIKKGAASYPAAMQTLEGIIASNPQLPEAYFNKGYVHHQLGQLNEAAAAYKKALELKPDFVQATANLADVLRQQREYARALEIIDEALKTKPDNALLLNNRALVMRQLGDTDRAIEDVRKILKVNAIDVNAFNNLGRIYLGQREYEMATVVFQKALSTVDQAKDDPYIHHNLGVAYLNLKDPRAYEEFERALQLKPDMVESLIGRAYLSLEQQEYDKAADYLRQAVAVEPRNLTARIALGVASRGLNDLAGAEIQYEEALRIDPKSAAALMDYGILLGDYKKEYLRAAEIYKRLRDVTPAGPDAERVDKLIKEANTNYERERKRQEKQRLQQEEKARAAAAATPAPATTPAPGATPAPSGSATPP